MPRKYLFLFYILFPLLGWSHPNIAKIPLEDRETLEKFFDFLIHNSIIGYPLCGDKPVSIETFPSLARIPTQYAIKIFSKHPGYSIVWKGIKTWEHYSHLFPSNNFFFRFVSAYNTIVLINKKAAFNVIKENLDLFQKYTNTNQNVTEFLQEVICPKDKDYMIRYHTTLLGILLGYGRNNSIAFTKKHYFQKLEGFKLYNSDDSLNAIMNPGFVIINNGTNEEENGKIRQTFRQAKQMIEASFEKGHYLENFVDLLTKE